MSTAELIYEKAKTLPGKLQTQALDFVEYLGHRRGATEEALAWQKLAKETQDLPSAQYLSDEEIVAEVVAYRARQ
ncbi:MAG: hypothetical protein NTZ01_01560 [Verrucomicrobia bacterium]|nr:hypothetical protein [Verrucomicrobiota bacterium]